MEIIKKIAKKNKDVYSCRPATIAFFGDSVTQGCFELYPTSENTLDTVFDQSSAYHTYLRDRLAEMFPASPVVIVNAGISGDNATLALSRIERDVLSYKPDLVVVGFGLNDCSSGEGGINKYANSMRKIFTAIKQSGAEAILLTPNVMADYLSVMVKYTAHPFVLACTEATVQHENSGILDKYVQAARDVARELDVPICDAHARWKRLKELGADTTAMLSNYANHPTRAMNKMFAEMLLDTMIDN